MFCGKCGKPNADTSRFCENCGNPLIAVATPAPTSSEPYAPQGRPTLISTMRKSVPTPAAEPVPTPVVEPVAAPIELEVEPTVAPVISQPEPMTVSDLFVSEPTPEPISEPVAAPAVEPVAAPIELEVEPTVAPVISQPESMPVSDLFVSEPTPEPISEPVAAPAVEPVAAPIELEVEPIAAPVISQPEPMMVSDLFVSEPTPEPVAEPVPTPVVEPVAAPIELEVEPIAAPVISQPEPMTVSDLFVSEPAPESIAEPVAAPTVEPADAPAKPKFNVEAFNEFYASEPEDGYSETASEATSATIPEFLTFGGSAGTEKVATDKKKKIKKESKEKTPMPKNKKKLIIISAILAVVVAVGVIFFVMSGEDAKSANTPEAAFSQYMDACSTGNFDKYISLAPEGIQNYLEQNKECYDLSKAQFRYDNAKVESIQYEIIDITECDKYTVNDIEGEINSLLRFLDEGYDEIRVEEAMRISYNVEINSKDNALNVNNSEEECWVYRLENSDVWYVSGTEETVKRYVW